MDTEGASVLSGLNLEKMFKGDVHSKMAGFFSFCQQKDYMREVTHHNFDF